MTFDEAIAKADKALDAAEKAAATPEQAHQLASVANTWVRIAELLHHREADSK